MSLAFEADALNSIDRNGPHAHLFQRLRRETDDRIMTNATDLVGQQLIAFLPNMRRFALSLCRNGATADDLVQLACERALAAAASFQPGTRFDAWIFRIIRNLWIDQVRRDKTAGPQDDIADHHESLAAPAAGSAEVKLELADTWRAIETLPADQREVLVLVCIEELSYRDAAEALEVPIGTVMSRLARARINLAKAVGISGDPARSRDMGKDQR
jgi:RNA polymerase sigma-70 factor (ECF subfamily)